MSKILQRRLMLPTLNGTRLKLEQEFEVEVETEKEMWKIVRSTGPRLQNITFTISRKEWRTQKFKSFGSNEQFH